MKTRTLAGCWFSARTVAIGLTTFALLSGSGGAADLKVLKTGLGFGTVTSDLMTGGIPDIQCGSDCNESYTGNFVILTAVPDPTDTSSFFVGWQGDCMTVTATTCEVLVDTDRVVRAEFGIPAITPLTDITPAGIAAYLSNPANNHVKTAARFIAALPPEYRRNWILMSRSESLQTGTARSPRILLPSADARNVFTVGMTTHASYPGAHPNAIEYMQWDAGQKNFRFHEIVLDHIPALPPGAPRFDPRDRSVAEDDVKCSKCHSTRNVLNLDRSVTPPVPGPYPGTDGVPPGSVKAKSKPNWEAYDSWGGMMPFNRDRIYQNSAEETAFRSIFNLWNWRSSAEDNEIRQVLEQLELQPPAVNNPGPHSISRNPNSTTDTGHIVFGFDSLPPLATTTSMPIGYSFGGPGDPAAGVPQGGRYVTLRHTGNPNPPNNDYSNPGSDEGRAVQLFDLLGGLDGHLNAERIADEVINHRFATGSFPIDVRPMVMAISKGDCLQISGTMVTSASGLPTLTIDLGFFTARNRGLNISQMRNDTVTRLNNLTRRKADIQKRNLDRRLDPYLSFSAPEDGLLQRYAGIASPATSRIRQEVFRRPIDLGIPDATVMGGFYIDREKYIYNTDRVALYRYFLEPLGVSVDKWSMNVRGRSRAYNFADVFSTYADVLQPRLTNSMLGHTDPADPASPINPALQIPGLTNPDDCGQLITAINRTLSMSPLPGDDILPTFTDVQRIFNKSCIECHGGLGYPPYGARSLDLSENERPAATAPALPNPRLGRSYNTVTVGYTTTDPATSTIYQRITDTDESCPAGMPARMMPCGGPPLTPADIETIRRWIVGIPGVPGSPRPSTVGDPHVTTVNGINYDFQGAGEFVLLRDENLEIQTRQTAIPTESPLPPNDHTGLTSCVSLNTAVAIRFGTQRITYQPNLSGRPDPEGLQLRIDGKLTRMGAREILLNDGGRIVRTVAPGGIQIEVPGGTVIVVTPALWDYHQLWHINIDVARARATQGVMGVIARGNWLPSLPDGTWMGPRPADLRQRYQDLYVRFADAWRVGDASSLFDYAPGTSTRNFTLPSWPGESPNSCLTPQQPAGTPQQPPLKPLSIEVAGQHCAAILAKDRKANCELDVMATGEPGFAKAYLLSQQVERNGYPTAPVLRLAQNTVMESNSPVTFSWSRSSDPDGDPISYRHCVWLTGEPQTFKDCDAVAVRTVAWERSVLHTLLALIAGVLLFLALLWFGIQRRDLLGLLAAAILAAVIAVFYLSWLGYQTVSTTVAALKPGEIYLWKVIAEDDKGGMTESETRRLTIAR